MVLWKWFRKWFENFLEFYFFYFNVLFFDERLFIGFKKLVLIWIISRYIGIFDKSLRGIYIVVFLGDDVCFLLVLDNFVYYFNNKLKEIYKEFLVSRIFN